MDGRSFDETQGLSVHLALDHENNSNNEINGGSENNGSSENNGTTVAAKTYTVNLLYRPGHYDILNR